MEKLSKEAFVQVISWFKSEWPHSYGEARVRILWDAWKHLPDEVLVAAAREVLYRHTGGAPTGAQIEPYIEKERLRYFSRQGAHEDRRLGETLAAPVDSPVALECQRQIREILEGKTLPPPIDLAEEGKRLEALKAQARTIDWKEKQAGQGKDE